MQLGLEDGGGLSDSLRLTWEVITRALRDDGTTETVYQTP